MAAPIKPKGLQGLLGGITIKPLTQENLLYHYAPMAGAASYTTLSISLSNPYMLRRLFPTRDITNGLLLTSIAGTALYIYKRPHLEKLPNHLKITYSIYGASMLSLSSILIWSILRYYLPDNAVIHTATGVATSIGLLILSKDYLDLVDKK